MEHNINFQPLFNPRAVAVIGATESEKKPGRIIYKQLMASGRTLYPVNPNKKTVFGWQVIKSIYIPARVVTKSFFV